MDLSKGIKVLVVGFLGLVAVCSGGHAPGAARYDYSSGQQSSNLNKILKAVLVHESTGHGLHSGSISHPNGGGTIKVTKQSDYRVAPRPRNSYPATQPMKPYSPAADVNGIRVFHQSIGNSGKINPQQYAAPVMKKNSPRGQSDWKNTHSRPDQRYGNQDQSVFKPNSFQGNAGYQYGNNQRQGNANLFYGAARQAELSGALNSVYQTKLNSGAIANGYQYTGPIKSLDIDLSNENLKLLNGGSGGFQQYQNKNPNQVLSTNIWQPSSPKYENYEAGRSFGGSPARENDNVYGGWAQQPAPFSRGYRYEKPRSNGNSNTEGQQNVISPTNNGYRYDPPRGNVNQNVRQTQNVAGQQPALKNKGYSYEGPKNNANLNNGAQEVAIPQHFSSTLHNSANGYRYEKNEATQGTQPQGGRILPSDVNQMRQHSSQSQFTNQVNEAAYQFQQSGQTVNIGSGYNRPLLSQSVAPQIRGNIQQNNGYRYDKPDSAKSVFKGQPYLPTTTGGVEAHRNADVSNKAQQQKSVESAYKEQPYLPKLAEAPIDRPLKDGNKPDSARSVFKGQPYLPIPSVTNENEARNNDYQYTKPKQPASVKATFMGQDFLPLLPPPSNNGYQYDTPPNKNDGYRYDKPEQSNRPSTVFKGQPYLPPPLPASG